MGSACGSENFKARWPARTLSEDKLLEALTRKIRCLRSLELEPEESKNWQAFQTTKVQDFLQNPVLRPAERLSGNPSILEVAGEYHLFLPCASGIVHLSSRDGLSNWTITELAVGLPGAVCPFVRVVKGIAHLFYEQRGEFTFHPAQIFLKTAPVPEESAAWCWSEPQKVLEPQLEWEKVGMSRVGSPFAVHDEKRERWLLYYSASVTFLTDAGLDEPMYIGVAGAPALKGPYQRLSQTPLFRTASDVHPQIIGAGSFKMIEGFETLEGEPNSGDQSQRRLLALQNRITRTVTGVTGSSIALLASTDGLSWSVLDANFLTPTERPGWKMAYMLAFDTIMPSSDSEHIFLYYHAREEHPGSQGYVGVSRIQRSFLEELACSQATRVVAWGP